MQNNTPSENTNKQPEVASQAVDVDTKTATDNVTQVTQEIAANTTDTQESIETLKSDVLDLQDRSQENIESSQEAVQEVQDAKDINTETESQIQADTDAVSDNAASDVLVESQLETTSEVVSENSADVVLDKMQETEVEETVVAEIEEESSFFGRNWTWLTGLAGGGVYLATKNDDEPVPIPTIEIIAGDNVVDSAEVLRVSGTADRNATVAVTIGSVTKNVTSDEQGNYDATFSAEETLEIQGSQTVSVISSVNEGRVSESTTASISIDTIAPDVATTNLLAVDNVINAAEQSTAVISGSAEADSTITMTFAGLTKTITTSGEGVWSYAFTADDFTAIGQGSVDLTITVSDSLNNTSDPIVVAINVDTLSPAAPAILDVTVNNIIITDELSTAAISGTAEASAQLEVTLLGETQSVAVGADGNWSLALTSAQISAMGQGDESVSVSVTDSAGNTSATSSKTFSVDTITPTVQGFVADATAQTITINYDSALDVNSLPDVTAFSVMTGNIENPVSVVSITGSQVVLNLTNAFSSGSAVTVGYTDAQGDQANAIQDTSGNDVESFTSSVVADGYIRDALIYIDSNDNGIADESELVTGLTTDAQGSFILDDNANPGGHAIIAMGGVNIDTGIANTVPLKAPAGSTVINPLTTLIQATLDNDSGLSVADANTIVARGLGISTDIDLANFDPISAVQAGGANAADALVIQKAAIQIVSLISIANEGKSTADSSSDSVSILSNLVNEIVSKTTVNLSDATTLTAALGNVTTTTSATDLAVINTSIANASDLAALQVAQAEALDEIAPLAPLSVELDALTSDNTPSVKVSFNTSDTQGRAVVAGDKVQVTATLDSETVVTVKTITAADAQNGFVDIDLLTLADGAQNVSAVLMDRAQNTSDATTAAITIDTTSPNVTLALESTSVNASQTVDVTFSFDEAPGDTFTLDDITVTGGSVSELTGTGTTRTVTFTPAADFDGMATIKVAALTFTDEIGNDNNASEISELAVDTLSPSVTITSDETTLAAGENATVTFTFSEDPLASFTLADITVLGGTLSDLSSEGTIRTATFTPSTDTEAVASITVSGSSFVDAIGNPGTNGTTPTLTIDTKPASLTVTTLSAAENATSVATLVADETATLSLGEGDDSALFSLTDGVLSLVDAKDFETDTTSYTVNINLVDAAGNTSSEAVTVNLTNVNEAPTVVSVDAQTGVVGQSYSLALATVFADVDANDTLTYSIESGNLPTGVSLVDGMITGTPTAELTANNVVVKAVDAGGLSVTQTISFGAVAQPVINALSVSETLATVGDDLTFVVTLSEEFVLTLNDETPTLTVTVGGVDVVAQYASHDGSAGTVTFNGVAPSGDGSGAVVKSIALGEATVIGALSNQPLLVTKVGQSTDAIEIDNTSAKLTVTTLSAAENATSVATLVADETATLSLGEGDDSALFSLTDGVLSLVDAKDFETDATSYTVNVNLVDAAGNSSSEAVTVNLTNVNEAPTVAADIADSSAVVGVAFSLDVTPGFVDIDADDTLTYSIESGTLPTGLALANGVISGTASAEVTASNIVVKATDAGGLSVTQTVSIGAVTAPVITTALSSIGDSMLDVRSPIILQIDQDVSAVSGKTITLTDNTETGYQGETNTNSFTIAVTDTDLVTIDNDNGLIIIHPSANFDLDLSSNYTLSVDTGAFVSTASGQSTVAFSDVSFATVTPTTGADNLDSLGQADIDASILAFIPDYLLTDAGSVYASFPAAFQLTGATLAWAELTADEKEPYLVLSTGAESVKMSTTDGSLVDSSEWIDIEGLGNGTNASSVSTLAADVESGNVFELDASTSDYVFVFSDQNPNGGDETVGAGLSTNSDFAVFIDEFGADDQIYVDDSFNDADKVNTLSYEVFASGNGDEGSELFLGLTGASGDPKLYVGLAGDLVSEDDSDNADSTLVGVNSTLGLTGDADDSAVITA